MVYFRLRNIVCTTVILLSTLQEISAEDAESYNCSIIVWMRSVVEIELTSFVQRPESALGTGTDPRGGGEVGSE